MATVTLQLINLLLYPRNRLWRFQGYIIGDLKVQRCNKALMEGDLSDENHRFYSSNKLSQMIFFNKGHSLQFIPEKYRGLIEHEQDGVLSYLNTAMTNYLYTLE